MSCILGFIRPSCQLLFFNILEYRFSNYIFANYVQELCFQDPELVISELQIHLKYKSWRDLL